MEQRYCRNLPALSEAEQARLAQQHVLVAGCGGLGGYLCEYMLRLGVGEITAADGDCFDESNLNRQILCTGETLGVSKAAAAKQRALDIDPAVRFHAVEEPITQRNARSFVAGKALVLDALDSAAARRTLADACEALGVPLIHGAICAWQVQVSTMLPGSGTMRKLYPEASETPACASTLSFVPAYCAAVQACEALKILCGRESDLAGKLFLADLETMEQHIFPLL